MSSSKGSLYNERPDNSAFDDGSRIKIRTITRYRISRQSSLRWSEDVSEASPSREIPKRDRRYPTSRYASSPRRPSLSSHDSSPRPAVHPGSASTQQGSDRGRRFARSSSPTSASSYGSLFETPLSSACSSSSGEDNCGFTNKDSGGILLACGHRICRKCLEGKFRTSLERTRHPYTLPLCCTNTPIALEKVELLFTEDEMRQLKARYNICGVQGYTTR